MLSQSKKLTFCVLYLISNCLMLMGTVTVLIFGAPEISDKVAGCFANYLTWTTPVFSLFIAGQSAIDYKQGKKNENT